MECDSVDRLLSGILAGGYGHHEMRATKNGDAATRVVTRVAKPSLADGKFNDTPKN